MPLPLAPHALSILWPVFALAGWTLCILLLLAYRRVRATVKDKVGPRAYALGESAQVPVGVTLANRNYMNLLELPLLFYVLCLMAYATGAATAAPALVPLAWLYVLLRVLHSLVHVGYNHVMHRFAVFAAGNVVLTCLWLLLGRALLAASGGAA